MKSLAIALLASSAVFATATPVFADSYAFVLRSRTIAADLTIQVSGSASDTVHGSDGYTVTGVSGWFEDISFGSNVIHLTNGDSAIVPADPGSSSSDPTYSDGFSFDNLMYPTARIDSIFDWNGLLLSVWGMDGYTETSPYLLKLFTDSSTTNEGFMYWSDNASAHELPMPLIAADPTLTPIATPEPGSLLLFGTGLLAVFGITLMSSRRARAGSSV